MFSEWNFRQKQKAGEVLCNAHRLMKLVFVFMVWPNANV